jgi:hypothetical protein
VSELKSLGSTVSDIGSAFSVYEPAPGHGQQPGLRLCWYALQRPPLEGNKQGLAKRVFGTRNVA